MTDYDKIKATVEKDYPKTCDMLKDLLEEEYKLFINKQYDYGPTNISVGQDLSKPEGRDVAKAGLVFRLNDKVQRLINLVIKKRTAEAANEPIQDAWKDSSFTHNRTGIYGTMFVAAAIACAQIFTDRIKIFETALKYIPQRSRFHERVSACILDIKDSNNWEEGYKRINNKYGEYGHCRIYQEIGMLINTLKFAESIGNGICIQVSQGADTDSFGGRRKM